MTFIILELIFNWYEVQAIWVQQRDKWKSASEHVAPQFSTETKFIFFFAEANFIKIVFKISEYQYYENMLNAVCNDNR